MYTQTAPATLATAHPFSYPDDTQLAALDDAQLAALDAALCYRPGQTRRVNFGRTLVRRAGGKTYTTVCYDDEYLSVAMRFAYGEMSIFTTALKRAALTVKEDRPGRFSAAVRAKALASLRGHYLPARAAALAAAQADAAQILSDVNNAAWSAVEDGSGVLQ